MLAAFPHPHQVESTMPRTSPTAQPVKQCSVSLTAVDQEESCTRIVPGRWEGAPRDGPFGLDVNSPVGPEISVPCSAYAPATQTRERLMMRRLAATLAGGAVAATTLLLIAVASPAVADGGPVIAGNFSGRLVLTKTSPDISTKSGPRTLSFGQGCATSTGCAVTRSGSGARPAQDTIKPQGGGGFGWSGRQVLACYDKVTGELGAKNGA